MKMTPQELMEYTIQTAHGNSDIDGYGDEGAGYDYAVFAEELMKMGWIYNPEAAQRFMEE